jgi:hypothetical protein
MTGNRKNYQMKTKRIAEMAVMLASRSETKQDDYNYLKKQSMKKK